MIYTQASETVNSVNMSSQEAQAFNDQYLKYNGTKRGTEVNALLTTVLNNNMYELTNTGENSAKYITVSGATVDAKNGTIKKVDAGKRYDVQVQIDPNSGLVHTITITEKTTKKEGN